MSPQSSSTDGRGLSSRSRSVLTLLALLALAAGLRLGLAFGDGHITTSPLAGLLKSDPALIHYLTEGIVEAGGVPPADYRADPRIEYPETVDIPATYTVGQEFPVAWLYLALDGRVPLHLVALWFMGAWASLTVLGLWGLTHELTGSRRLALLGAIFWIALPATWRTAGLIHMREDFALPFFAAHLWLMARAWRRPTPATWCALGLATLAALSTWHAMGLVLALEGALLLAWSLRRGRSPLEDPVSWLAPALILGGAALVPVIAERAGWTTPALACLIALWSGGLVCVLRADRRRLRPVMLVVLLFLLLLGALGNTGADMAHTRDLLLAKLRFLGRLPLDPERLSPTVRLMWQGPFATASPAVLAGGLGLLLPALPLLLPTAWRHWRKRGGPQPAEQATGLLANFALLSLLAAWAFQRLLFLPALLGVPAVLASLPSARRRLVPALVALQVTLSLGLVITDPGLRGVAWYAFEARQQELVQMTAAVAQHLPEEAPLAADFLNSAAVLAHDRRPILFQPKWETERSRARNLEFLRVFFDGTPAELRRLLLEDYGCRYLLVDRFTLWYLARYAGGQRWSAREPRPQTAAAALLSRDGAQLTGIDGYELLWRSPTSIRQSNGQPTDFYRLFRLSE
ncbi:MAG: hypothetical protein CMJ87_07055 [Planctomycetes bacterium]|jgi:hypothetical protein|nr:hypothetical protein [Planctomycetota bacterium]